MKEVFQPLDHRPDQSKKSGILYKPPPATMPEVLAGIKGGAPMEHPWSTQLQAVAALKRLL